MHVYENSVCASMYLCACVCIIGMLCFSHSEMDVIYCKGSSCTMGPLKVIRYGLEE